MFEERTVTIWNICLVPKQRKNGVFLNGVCRYFVKENRIPGVYKNRLYVVDTQERK